MDISRELDVVVFGASGFVGRLTAEHLAAHAPSGTRIGLSGRSLERLTEVRDSLGPDAAGWPLIVADVDEPASLRALAARTRVLATTVGPYLKYGLGVVEACASAGTDYVDLTGEVLFVRESLDHWADVARDSGARIVHSCGFDSIPSDLGVLLLAEAAHADGAGTLEETVLVVRSFGGGVSGGTIDSARTMAMAVADDRSLLKVLGDPYALSPDRDAEPDTAQPSDNARIRRSAGLGTWVGPFVMASYNTRVVRMSNALQDWAYGRTFRYGEEMAYGGDVLAPVRAAAVNAGLAAGVAAFAFGPTRAVVDRFLPKPGEGPSEETRMNGHFSVEVRSRTTSGATYGAVIAADGDPGYQATSVMLGESALALVHDRDRLPDRAGVLTAASGIGSVLAERLRAQGFTITVQRI
ncbi:saccharopine dehydrogenase family protein [Longivirga aurantiaca]|uniref:Saccharopine dehydrogenase family protein n=1 Tax=Longivirga aurantiaca TaxID=1837743 RepID=A0ABW1SZ66_9ACTN